MKQNTIFALLLIATIIALSSCSQKIKDNDSDDQLDYGGPFIGKWQSVERGIPYKAVLLVNADGSFSFTYVACTISGFSSGTWFLEDGILTMNSVPADTCLFVREFGEDCYTNEQLEGFMPETTIPDCKPEDLDEFVLFQNVKFQLIGDTLKHLYSSDRICPEIRNDFFRP